MYWGKFPNTYIAGLLKEKEAEMKEKGVLKSLIHDWSLKSRRFKKI